MKQKLLNFSLTFLCIISALSLNAQHRFADIPLITLDSFQAEASKDAKLPIYINSRIYYRIDTVIQKNKNKYQVWVKTKIEQRPEDSFWTASRDDKEVVARLLAHEQGHVYLAHIAGNNIEKAMPKFNFTENWKDEVKAKFQELLRKEHETSIQYDKETVHSRDLKAQEKWDKWIKKELTLKE